MNGRLFREPRWRLMSSAPMATTAATQKYHIPFLPNKPTHLRSITLLNIVSANAIAECGIRRSSFSRLYFRRSFRSGTTFDFFFLFFFTSSDSVRRQFCVMFTTWTIIIMFILPTSSPLFLFFSSRWIQTECHVVVVHAVRYPYTQQNRNDVLVGKAK